LNSHFGSPKKAAVAVSLDAPRKRLWISVICGTYLALATVFASTTLDSDEWSFSQEPYELLGGDYTSGYLSRGDYGDALRTAAKSYFFFWNYRPLSAPVISEDHRSMFAREEKAFGYVKPDPVKTDDPTAVQKYQRRLIVPETDRFYAHGAGKPLLSAVLSIPQFAFVKAMGIGAGRILASEYYERYDAMFIIFRLVQILAGLASIYIVFKILERKVDFARACLGASIFAIFPITIKYFPNLHHDAILVPFVLLAVYFRMLKRFASAGIAYGLALASKNVAIILFPAMVADLGISAFLLWRGVGVKAAATYLRPPLAGLSAMMAVAFVTFLPFANPISYAEEILTPVISRPIDPRGENISQWTVEGMVADQQKLSPQLIFSQKFLYFHDIGFMFLVLAVGLAAQRQLTSTGRLSTIILVLYLPLSSVFGLALEWRTLLLVPFFAMVAAELLRVNQLRWLAAGMAVLALVYISDPARTDKIHNKLLVDHSGAQD